MLFNFSREHSRASNPLLRALRAIPHIEILEQRITPTAIAWIGGNGDWSDSTKWSGGAVPTANDDVTINPSGGDFTITVSDARAAHSVTMSGDDNLAITGSLTLSPASNVPSLDLSGSG